MILLFWFIPSLVSILCSGHNNYLKIYHDDDKYCAAVVRPFLKRNLDIIRDTELNAPDYSNFIIIFMHLCWCVFSVIIIIIISAFEC